MVRILSSRRQRFNNNNLNEQKFGKRVGKSVLQTIHITLVHVCMLYIYMGDARTHIIYWLQLKEAEIKLVALYMILYIVQRTHMKDEIFPKILKTQIILIQEKNKQDKMCV